MLDLYGAPLRAQLVRCSATKHYLLIAVSPLCADSVSLQNLVRELGGRVWRGDLSPADEPLQYADYAAWQEDALASDTGEGERYWRSQLRSDGGSVRLALENWTEDATAFDPATVSLSLPQDQVCAVADLAERRGVDPRSRPVGGLRGPASSA